MLYGMNLILKAARVREGLTQQQLADLIGVPQSTVGRWEGGHTVPNLTHYRRLVRVLSSADAFELLDSLVNDGPPETAGPVTRTRRAS